MAKREGISKSTRFEVFKRDKFTCQYCGGKSPEIVLNVDHIDPVAEGGTNEIINLITSCFDCNNGKRDKLLSDTSVVEKQRKQLELLQERREQIELMLEWKKSLSEFDNDVQSMLADYIDSKINPLSLNESGKKHIADWLKKFDVATILDGIDIAAKKYIKYNNDEIDQASAELFINKIGGVIVVKNMPPIQQKIAYIKGIARNRFSYWDDRKGSIILSNYIKELQLHYDEEEVLTDLGKEVEKITKESKNWTDWKNTLEKWTSDIQAWEKPDKKNNRPDISEKEFTTDDLERFVYHSNYEQEDHIKAVEYVASIFPEFDKNQFRSILKPLFLDFLRTKNDFDNRFKEYESAREYIAEYVQQSELPKLFHYEYENHNDDMGLLMVLENKIYDLLTDVFMFFYFPIRTIKQQYLEEMIAMHITILTNSDPVVSETTI